jgi:hypothetical protein
MLAMKFGYRWLVGNGEKVKFWEDIWFRTAHLAVQFLELYCICYEKTKIVPKVLVEGELRLSFRRNFNEDMMVKWGELCVVVEQLNLSDESDALLWGYERSGVYYAQSFYVVINYRV